MTRAEAIQHWRAIAAGALQDPEYDPFDYFEWIRGVATAVVEADGEPEPNRRVARIVAAVGLNGQPDRHADLKAFIERYLIVLDFWPDDEPPPTRAQQVNMVFAAAVNEGLINGYYVDEPRKGKDLIRDLLQSMPKTL